jgi:hypothetical protein
VLVQVGVARQLLEASLVLRSAQCGWLMTSAPSAAAIYNHHKDDTIGSDLWAGIDAALTDMLRTRVLLRYWEIRKHWFSAEFQGYISSRISNGDEIDFYPPGHASRN